MPPDFAASLAGQTEDDPVPPTLDHGPRIPLPLEVCSIPTFSGDQQHCGYDAHQWLELVDDYANMWCWSETTRLQIARIRLTGPAYHWMITLSKDVPWAEFVEQFLARFGESIEVALSRLAACKQESGEPVDSYVDRFRHDCALAGREDDEALRYQFAAGLHPRLRIEVHRQLRGLKSLTDMICAAREWETFLAEEHWSRATAASQPRFHRAQTAQNHSKRGGQDPHWNTPWEAAAQRHEDRVVQRSIKASVPQTEGPTTAGIDHLAYQLEALEWNIAQLRQDNEAIYSDPAWQEGDQRYESHQICCLEEPRATSDGCLSLEYIKEALDKIERQLEVISQNAACAQPLNEETENYYMAPCSVEKVSTKSQLEPSAEWLLAAQESLRNREPVATQSGASLKASSAKDETPPLLEPPQAITTKPPATTSNESYAPGQLDADFTAIKPKKDAKTYGSSPAEACFAHTPLPRGRQAPALQQFQAAVSVSKNPATWIKIGQGEQCASTTGEPRHTCKAEPPPSHFNSLISNCLLHHVLECPSNPRTWPMATGPPPEAAAKNVMPLSTKALAAPAPGLRSRPPLPPLQPKPPIGPTAVSATKKKSQIEWTALRRPNPISVPWPAQASSLSTAKTTAVPTAGRRHNVLPQECLGATRALHNICCIRSPGCKLQGMCWL